MELHEHLVHVHLGISESYVFKSKLRCCFQVLPPPYGPATLHHFVLDLGRCAIRWMRFILFLCTICLIWGCGGDCIVLARHLFVFEDCQMLEC